MAVLPLALCALMFGAAPVLPGPTLRVGDELVYTGDTVEESLRPGQIWKRSAKIEVRYFVLAVRDGVTDLAAMTLIHPQDDAAIAKVAAEMTGTAKDTARRAPAVRLELVRLDAKGMTILAPELATLPVILTAKTPAVAIEPISLDSPNNLELGGFPQRPTGAKPGDVWTQSDGTTRPKLQWTAKPLTMLDGAEVIEIQAVQQSEQWQKPSVHDTPWQRTERVWISPVDGVTRVLWRRLECKDGAQPMTRIETRLDLQPTVPKRGEGYERVKREIEFALWFAAQVNSLTAEQRPALAARIERYCQDYPTTPYREAVEAAARRCQASK